MPSSPPAIFAAPRLLTTGHVAAASRRARRVTRYEYGTIRVLYAIRYAPCHTMLF